jgi:hypothetical protein
LQLIKSVFIFSYNVDPYYGFQNLHRIEDSEDEFLEDENEEMDANVLAAQGLNAFLAILRDEELPNYVDCNNNVV